MFLFVLKIEYAILWKGTMPMTKRVQFTVAETAFIAQMRVARLATADTEGRPFVVPICYAFDGELFYTPLDQKPKRVEVRELRRVKNLLARPEASLLIDQYADDWSQLGYLLVQTQAQIVEPGDPLHFQGLPLLRARYTQYRMMTLEELPMIVLTPKQITAWGPALKNDKED